MYIAGRPFRITLSILSIMLALYAALTLAGNSGINTAKSRELPLLSSLKQVGQTASQKKVPILLMFSISNCRYCSKLENQVLHPMHISGEYDDKVIIRKVITDMKENIEDFAGNKIRMKRLTDEYKVAIYPTVLLLDHNGKILADRLVGINSVEMYSWDVEVAIDRAIKQLNES